MARLFMNVSVKLRLKPCALCVLIDKTHLVFGNVQFLKQHSLTFVDEKDFPTGVNFIAHRGVLHMACNYHTLQPC